MRINKTAVTVTEPICRNNADSVMASIQRIIGLVSFRNSLTARGSKQFFFSVAFVLDGVSSLNYFVVSKLIHPAYDYITV